MSSGSERRRSRRFALKLPIAVYPRENPHATAGYLNDLSDGGAFVQITWSVADDVPVFIRFNVMEYQCEATGAVLRSVPFGPESYGIAIAFGFANQNFHNFVMNLENIPEAQRPEYLQNVKNLQIVLG
jgi:hypothetical protein